MISTIMLLYYNGYNPQQPTYYISVLYSKGHFIYTYFKHLFSLRMLSLEISYILLSFFIVFPTNLVGYIFYSLYYILNNFATTFNKKFFIFFFFLQSQLFKKNFRLFLSFHSFLHLSFQGDYTGI